LGGAGIYEFFQITFFNAVLLLPGKEKNVARAELRGTNATVKLKVRYYLNTFR
jgi:hypothetical protein